jgi:hypothetical protein
MGPVGLHARTETRRDTLRCRRDVGSRPGDRGTRHRFNRLLSATVIVRIRAQSPGGMYARRLPKGVEFPVRKVVKLRALSIPLALLTVGLLPSTTSASVTGASVAASTPKQAVWVFVRAYASENLYLRYAHTGCHPGQGGTLRSTVGTCPITTRLRSRLYRLAVLGAHSPGNPVCRCQNPPQTIALFPAVSGSRPMTVEGLWDYGSNSFVITYVVVRKQRGWLIDDMYCLRRPGTSVYTSRAGSPCP